MSTRKAPKPKTAANTDLATAQQNAIVPIVVPKPTAFEEEMFNALDKLASSVSVIDDSLMSVDGVAEYLESEELKKSLASASVKKPRGTFPAKGIVVQVNPYKKKDHTVNPPKDVTSYMVTVRIADGSVSEKDAARLGIMRRVGPFGPYYVFKCSCNLSAEKFAAYKAEKDLLLAEQQAAKSLAATMATSNVAPPTSSSSASASSTTASTTKVTLLPPGQKRNAAQALLPTIDASLAAKTAKTNSTKAIPTASRGGSGPIVEDPDTQHADGSALIPSHQQPGSNGTSQTGDNHHTGDSAPPVPIRVEENGIKVFDATDLHNKLYLGEEVFVEMHLPINRDITFSVDEKTSKSEPIPWSLAKVDIKGNPYVDKNNRYNVTGLTITGFSDTRPLPPSGIYKLFESVSQETPLRIHIHEYVKSSKSKPSTDPSQKYGSELENNTLMWLVVGSERTWERPYHDKSDRHHVVYQMERVRSPESFKRNDNNSDKVVGMLPYRFTVFQWTGAYSPQNPTLVRCLLELTLGWKHVCPSPYTHDNYKPGPNKSLGINSITAWTCLMCANYPHLKMALNVKENLQGTASILLNTTRYGEGMAKNDPDHVNKPLDHAYKRVTTPIFKKMVFIQRAIILPLETIKSCCIPVTQDYVVRVWGKRTPPAVDGATQLDSVPFIPIDHNNSVHCLSEASGTEQFFSDPLEQPNTRYNFYAMTNVCFKEQKDENGHEKYYSSVFRTLAFTPKTPQEGVVYLEAIRNIISQGGLKEGCFATETSVSVKDIGTGSVDEKYKRFLARFMVPETSVLYKIDPSELQIFHPNSKLLLYFYAVPVHLDDNADTRGKLLSDLNAGLSNEISSFLLQSTEDTADDVDDDPNTQQASLGDQQPVDPPAPKSGNGSHTNDSSGGKKKPASKQDMDVDSDNNPTNKVGSDDDDDDDDDPTNKVGSDDESENST
jgi:hypothetical protein